MDEMSLRQNDKIQNWTTCLQGRAQEKSQKTQGQKSTQDAKTAKNEFYQ